MVPRPVRWLLFIAMALAFAIPPAIAGRGGAAVVAEARGGGGGGGAGGGGAVAEMPAWRWWRRCPRWRWRRGLFS